MLMFICIALNQLTLQSVAQRTLDEASKAVVTPACGKNYEKFISCAISSCFDDVTKCQKGMDVNTNNCIRNRENPSLTTPTAGTTTASPAVSPYTYRLTTTEKCWNASRYECLSYGGDLAHKGIREFANRKRILNSSVDVWVGLSDLEKEGIFKWVNGEIANTSEIHWGENDPNNFNEEEHCVQMIHGNFTCFDEYCDLKRLGLCEIELK